MKINNKTEYHENLTNYSQKAFLEDKNYPKRYCYVLTNLCNLACNFCFQDRKKQHGAMTGDDWVKLTDELPPNSRVTLTGGEPVVFKDFERVKEAVLSVGLTDDELNEARKYYV